MLQMFHRVYQMIQNFKFYIAVVLCHQALFSLIKRPQLNALDLNNCNFNHEHKISAEIQAIEMT